MNHIQKFKVTTGVFWVEVPEVNLFVLCACPADSVKHLMKAGLIKTVERNGFSYETGPNAILLSEVLVQNGHFSNLAEFPVLQMLYRQGMIIPNHPNNTGLKPLLIGRKELIKSHMDYIYRGNYGLASIDEMIETGVDEEEAKEMMRLKLKFAFGRIPKTEELIDYTIVESTKKEIRNNVYIKRTGFNTYEFEYKNETVSVDLNLKANEVYDPPFELGFHQIRREYFSVIHSGEGDGWDINRPSMASILTFQGSLFLIDAGPNLLHTLTALGISINEIEGIFHTHAHDDHFAGLTTLIRADHRIKYFATPLVRASVTKKLCSLMSWNDVKLDRYFDVHDLNFDEWNNVNGLEVMPIFSPHPVETSIFIFRAIWDGGFRTYGHFADLTSFDVLKGMITVDEQKPGITREFFEQVKESYLTPVNLKKIDVGGGLIHGKAEDFKEDLTDKIILSHTALKFSDQQKEIGSRAPFGMVDVLISTNQDHTMRYAYRYLHAYFPTAPIEELRILLNCRVTSFNAGTILLKQGVVNPCIYLILTGTIEMIKSDVGVHRVLYAGSLVGELSGLIEVPSMETYCAASYVWALEIPSNLYSEFVKRNNLHATIEQIQDVIRFLHDTWLFGEMVSYPVQNLIAQKMTFETIKKKAFLESTLDEHLVMLYDGQVDILDGSHIIESIVPGGFFREEVVLYQMSPLYKIQAQTDTRVCFIPKNILDDIPVVQWKLLETFEKRQRLRPYF